MQSLTPRHKIPPTAGLRSSNMLRLLAAALLVAAAATGTAGAFPGADWPGRRHLQQAGCACSNQVQGWEVALTLSLDGAPDDGPDVTVMQALAQDLSQVATCEWRHCVVGLPATSVVGTLDAPVAHNQWGTS